MEIMPEFMVVSKVRDDDDGEIEYGATFFNSLNEAENARMTVECGLGGYAAVYEWSQEYEEYRFFYS